MSRLMDWALHARAFPFERRTATRAMALLWAVGGATVLLVTYLPHPPELRIDILSAVGAAALTAGVAVYLLRELVPAWALPWLGVVGIAVVTAVVAAGGGGTASVSLSFFYAWVVIYALLFFRPIVAAAEIALAAGAYAMILLRTGPAAGGDFTAVEPTVLAAVTTASATVVLLLAHGRRISEVDPLTGAANRRGLDRALEEAVLMPTETRPPLTLAVIDIDHFKELNDRQGHPAGDRVLRELVGRWRACLRRGDTLARLGGDEFVVVLPDCTAADAEGVLQRLREAATDGLTCSVGATEQGPGDSVSLLIARADLALYDAKRCGRDQIAWTRPDDLAAPTV